MTTREALRWAEWIDHEVYDLHGDKIGKLEEVYADTDTGRPSWLGVKTGLFGMNHTFVPVAGATIDEDHIVVPFEKHQVKDAPNIDPADMFDVTEERKLYEYYGMAYRSFDDEQLRLQRWDRSTY